MDARKEAILKQRLFRKPNKRIQVFLICILVSIFIWFTREITKEGINTLQIPIEIVGLNSKLIITSEIPELIEVRVSSFGIDRLKTELINKQKPLIIDLSDKQKTGTEQFHATKLIGLLRKSLGGEIEIVETIPNEINISFEKTVSKKIKILPRLNISYAEGYFLDQDYTCSPDSLIIYGGQSTLDTINYIYTDVIVQDNLDKSIVIEIGCQLSDNISSETITTSVSINVDEFTEGELYKRLPIFTLADNSKVSYFPDSIKISYLVGLNKYEEVKPSDFVLEIDNNNTSDHKREVKIMNHPDYVSNIRLFPNRVEFYISE